MRAAALSERAAPVSVRYGALRKLWSACNELLFELESELVFVVLPELSLLRRLLDLGAYGPTPRAAVVPRTEGPGRGELVDRLR